MTIRRRWQSLVLVLVLVAGSTQVRAQGPFTAQIEAFWRVISSGGRTFPTLKAVNVTITGTCTGCTPSGQTLPVGVAAGSVLVSNGVGNAPVYSATPSITSLTLATPGPISWGDAFIRRSAAKTLTIDTDGAGGNLTAINLDGPVVGSSSFTVPTGGAEATPNFALGAGGYGLYLNGTTQIGQSIAGVTNIIWTANEQRLGSGGILTWASGTNPRLASGDTGISRLSGAVVAIGNGPQGDFSGTVKVATVNATTAYQFNGNAFATATVGPSSPVGTSSTTLVMAGLAGSITTRTGRIELCMSGTQSDGTISDGSKVQASFGTGGAPSNGAALTGTQVGPIITYIVPGATAAQGGYGSCWIVTGLVSGTTYWLDTAFAAVTGGTATITQASMAAHDIP